MPAPGSTTTRSSRRWRRRPGSSSCSSPTAGRASCAAGAGGRCRRRRETCRPPSPTASAKFFPERILPEAELSVYVDANTLILSDLTPLIAEFAASGADIGLFRHRERASLAEELAFGRQVGKIPAADAAKGEAQLRHYREAGLPPDVALHRERHHLPPARPPGARRLRWSSGGRSSRNSPSATS